MNQKILKNIFFEFLTHTIIIKKIFLEINLKFFKQV